MNELDALETLYPAPPPLSEADRAAMRSELFGTPLAAREPETARRWMAVAASAIVLAGTVGIWAVSANRAAEPSPSPADQPATEPPIESTLPTGAQGEAVPAPDGALILDQLPASLAGAEGRTYVGTAEASGPPFPANTWVQRWYTTTMERPELEPHLKLASTSATQDPDEIPPSGVDATPVTVRNVTGWLYDDQAGDGRVVAFIDDDTVFVLTGYRLDDDELLRAADHTILADAGDLGAVIVPGGLPAGLVERAVGILSERGFTPLTTLPHPQDSIRWFIPRADGGPPSDGSPMLWLGWEIEDPALVPLHRLGYDTVTDATVRGLPAFVATTDGSDAVVIVWSENGSTYFLGAWGLDPDTALETANQLRPATDAEWNALATEPG